MKSLLLTVLLCLSLLPLYADDAGAAADGAPTPSVAGVDPVKQAEIRKMIETTGVLKMMDQTKARMIDMYRAQTSGLPPEFWTRLANSMDMNSLLEKMIPIYDKYYSLDDLKAINAFYESPVGKHMTTVAPQLMADSMKVGQAWGQEIGAHVGEEIDKAQKAGATATPPAAGAGGAAAPAPSDTK